MEKVFVVVSDIKGKIGPLRKKLNMSKSHEEKESLTQQIKTIEKELEKAKKSPLMEIVKAYELFCVYFVDKACTQWDKVVQEMHMKDPWDHLTRDPTRRPGSLFWTSSNSTSSQSSPVTPLSCRGTTCSSMSGSPNTLWCEPS